VHSAMQRLVLGSAPPSQLISWQCWPSGQSSVRSQTTGIRSQPATLRMQARMPSGLADPGQVQKPPPWLLQLAAAQSRAQLPLARQTRPAGHAGQDTRLPQVFVRVPQRPPQVAVAGSGRQDFFFFLPFLPCLPLPRLATLSRSPTRAMDARARAHPGAAAACGAAPRPRAPGSGHRSAGNPWGPLAATGDPASRARGIGTL
jgi:hypothetical protein